MLDELKESLALPFFHARKGPDQVRTDGEAHCLLGHKIGGTGEGSDGIFAEWHWDGRRLTVRNDRYGFFPVFYSVQDGEICVSQSIPRLLKAGAPAEIDRGAMAVFLRLGCFIGEDTPFRHVRALPPDATLEWSDGRLAVSGRFAFRKQQTFSRTSAVDAYISLFREAIRRRIPRDNGFGIPLSGGKDSRHILLELCGMGFRPKLCATVRRFPPCSGEDIRIASRLAGAVNSEHAVVEQGTSRFQAELRKNIRTNFCSDEHAWFLAVADHFQGKVHTVYDGIAGDVLSSSGYLSKERLDQFESGDFEALARSFFVNGAETIGQFIHPEIRTIVEDEYALDRLTEELKRHENAPNPVTSFVFWNRTRREIALSPYGVFRRIPTVYCPFLDHGLYDFLASLPPGIQMDRQFHSEVILRAFPGHAHIPFEDKKAPAPESRKQYLLFRKELALHAISGSPSTLFLRSSLMPRLLRPLTSRRLSPLVLYMLQLERIREDIDSAGR